jgi:protein-L-isoaspartate(D-aspartate) O-methyltransferase
MKHQKPSLPEGVVDYSSFQQAFWLVQRIAWIIFGLILIACLFGAFGRGGYLAEERLDLVQGSIEFPSISRWNAPEDLKITFKPSAQENRFVVDSRFFDAFTVEGIDPPVARTVTEAGQIAYIFSADAQNPSQVVFRLQAQQPGLQHYLLGIGGETATRTTFIFP